jgi:hypothetical protein
VSKFGVCKIYFEDATEIKYVFPWPMFSTMDMENVEMRNLLHLLYAELAVPAHVVTLAPNHIFLSTVNRNSATQEQHSCALFRVMHAYT